MTILTKDEREEAERLCARASEGPWGADGLELADKIDSLIIADGTPEGHGEEQTIIDMKFCAAARTLLPRALSTIAAVEAERDEAVRLLRDCRDMLEALTVQLDSWKILPAVNSPHMFGLVDAFLAKTEPTT